MVFKILSRKYRLSMTFNSMSMQSWIFFKSYYSSFNHVSVESVPLIRWTEMFCRLPQLYTGFNSSKLVGRFSYTLDLTCAVTSLEKKNRKKLYPESERGGHPMLLRWERRWTRNLTSRNFGKDFKAASTLAFLLKWHRLKTSFIEWRFMTLKKTQSFLYHVCSLLTYKIKLSFLTHPVFTNLFSGRTTAKDNFLATWEETLSVFP